MRRSNRSRARSATGPVGRASQRASGCSIVSGRVACSGVVRSCCSSPMGGSTVTLARSWSRLSGYSAPRIAFCGSTRSQARSVMRRRARARGPSPCGPTITSPQTRCGVLRELRMRSPRVVVAVRSGARPRTATESDRNPPKRRVARAVPLSRSMYRHALDTRIHPFGGTPSRAPGGALSR